MNNKTKRYSSPSVDITEFLVRATTSEQRSYCVDCGFILVIQRNKTVIRR